MPQTLQWVVGMLRFPRIVDHCPATSVGKSHATVLVCHTTSVVYLVVPGDLVTVVRLAVVSEELITRKSSSLVQQLDTARDYAIRSICVARITVVALTYAGRRRFEVVFMTVLHIHPQQRNVAHNNCNNCILSTCE